jgi:hypothetical protein
MKRLLIALVFLLAHQTAEASDISLVAQETPDHPAIMLVKGQFLKDDYTKDTTLFAVLAAYQKNAVVFLEGPGGKLITALQIGLIINQRGFSTAVADGDKCVSSCALIWLGGKERLMGNNSYLGFHAASDSRAKPEELKASSVGNAMIGAYLAQVGIKEIETIAFLTYYPPQSMQQLTLSNAIRYHISAKAFSFSQDEWSWAQHELEIAAASKGQPAKATTIDSATTANATFAFKVLNNPSVAPPAPPSDDYCVPSGAKACHCRLINQVMICNAIPLPINETIVPPVPQPAQRPSRK